MIGARSSAFRLRWAWARRLTALGFLILLILGTRAWFPWVKGSVAATTWFGTVPFADPLATLETSLASREWQGTLTLGALLVVTVSLLLGPVFCGWLCPLGLALDLNDWVRRRGLALLKPRQNRSPGAALPTWPRNAVLAFVVAFSLLAGLPGFQLVSPINLLAWTIVFFPTTATLTDDNLVEKILAACRAIIDAGGLLLAALLLLVAIEWLLPRLWCRTLCPQGAMYSLIGRRAPLRVRVKPGSECRLSCQLCTRRCPMGISVAEAFPAHGRNAIDDPACTRCGECVDGCPGGVLRLGFARRR